MYTPQSKKRQQMRLALIYVTMTLSVLVIASILVLFVQGYRFNRSAGTIVQSGMVQFNSIPSGASISLNSTRVSGTTSTKATIPPGSYSVRMSRTGYHDWRKSVEVKSGNILWLNYARMIPLELPVDNVAELPAVTSSLMSPSRKWLAMTTGEASPTVTLADISSDTPVITSFDLPVESFTGTEDKASEAFELQEWDLSSRYLLIKHKYEDKSEWIIVDIQNVENTINLTAVFDIDLVGAKFSNDNSKIIYALVQGDVRKIDTEGSTISAPLIRDVAEFSLFERSTIAYTTFPAEDTKERSVGYYKDGDGANIIKSFVDEEAVPLHIALGKYYGETYVGIARDNQVEIFKGTLPRTKTGVESPSTLKKVTTMTLPGPVDYLSNRTDGRFFVAQHRNGYSVYDLELKKLSTTSMKHKQSLSSELRWIDGYSIWNGDGGVVRLYEFDGANQHDIMPIEPGLNVALSPNNRYLYAPVKDDKGIYHLSRVRLTLP